MWILVCKGLVMQFVYPIDFEVNQENEDVKHLKGSSNTAGFFPIGRLNTWHGGIHFEGNMPIKAIADGRIIAYRVPKEYSEQVIDSSVGKYSNGFVLIQHSITTPEGKSLEFFSLYNHLIPQVEMKGNLVPDIFNTPGYIIKKTAKDKGNAYGLNLHASEKYSDKIVAAKGTKLTIDNVLTADEKDSKHWTQKNNGSFRKVKYTSPNGKEYKNYFICTIPKTSWINKKKISVDRVKVIGGNMIEVVIEEDKGWNGDIGGRERKKPGGDEVRIIPREVKINIDKSDNGGTAGWVRIINSDGSKGGYTYYSENVSTTKNCNLKDEDLNKVDNVDIKISAGTVIGFAGMYGVEKREHYRTAHVEVFTTDDPVDFLNNSADGQNALNYYKVLKDSSLGNSLPYLLLNQSRIKVHQTKGDYTKVEILDIVKDVPDRDSYLGTYNESSKTYTFKADQTTCLNNSNTLFGNLLKTGNSLKLLDTAEELAEKKNQTPIDTSRKVSFEYSIHGQKFWILTSSIAEEEQEENTESGSVQAQNNSNIVSPVVNTANTPATTDAGRGSTGNATTEASTNTVTAPAADDDIRELCSSVNELFFEHPDDFEEINIDIDTIVDLNKQKKYCNQNDEIRSYIKHTDYNSQGQQNTYKGVIGPIADKDLFSAYIWSKFGFGIYDDGNYDDYIYEPKKNKGLVKEIANSSYKYVDKNNKEHTQLIDADGDGVLEPHELQRALQRPHIAHRLSHMVVKHTSEWAYQDGLRDDLLNQVKKIYEEGIKNESDSTRKQELDDLKEKRLDALKAKMEALCFWKDIIIPASEQSPEAEEEVVSESGGDPLRMQIEEDLVIRQDNTTYVNPSENITPIRQLPLQVYHFHPVAFVEQMRRMKSTWHEPVRNPMLCLYTQNGNYRPNHNVFGYVRTTNNNNKHQGVDILALPNTLLFACFDGIVIRAETQSGYGKIIMIQIGDVEALKKCKKNYDLKYQDKGELAEGNGFNLKDNVYLFYAHLNSFSVKAGDEVKSGQVIGKSGTTGYGSSKDPHLHFEIRNKVSAPGLNSRCNPAFFVNYKNENNMSESEKEYQKTIAEKYWN